LAIIETQFFGNSRTDDLCNLTNGGTEMSFSIPTAFVEEYNDNVYHLTQQKKARLFGKSRRETQESKTEYFERISDTDSNEVTERHGDTILGDIEHTRRAVDTTDYDWAQLVDKEDKLRVKIGIEGEYVKAAVKAMNRRRDDVFIAAALGNARSGVSGGTNVALPSSQKVVATTGVNGSGASGFNTFTLTLVQKKFDEADIDEDDEDSKKYFAYSSAQKQGLLNDDQATNADYAMIKALVEGKITEWMGFKFIRTERLPVTAAATYFNDETGAVLASNTDATLAAGARRCFAWCEDGMVSSTGMFGRMSQNGMFVDIGPRRDKRVNNQVYVEISVGAVRMEEEKVVEVLVAE
jgi:hypothetical protein